MANHNKKSFLVGAIFGGLIGGITALLFAPKSGEKMRNDIAKKCAEMTEKTQEFVCDMNCQAKELVEKTREIAEEATDCAKSMIKRKK